MSKIWNVAVEKPGNHVFGYQVEADDIKEAIEKVEEFGIVIRASLSEYDTE
ncbi:hypothetical protein [Paenibacillus sp. Y412MC10]|uniref:hypothetical protein n=1 Tax=Geobacillus sp. (strain Y412MC10) TaxID=481743 RepID=UPI0016428F5A|nr:hypothetical protein [Paenibacillus sp. Y412MC10]